MKKEDGLRFGIVLLGIFVLYTLLVIRLFYWQAVEAESLSELSKAQSFSTLTVPALRGDILASDGFPLATNNITYLLYANPKLITDKAGVSGEIAPILGSDSASVSAKLSQDLFWVKLAQNIDSGQKHAIENLNIPGIGFEQTYSRFYPEASMAAQLVGFLGRDNEGQNHGYFGIEGQYNSQLSGRDGAQYGVRDALGNQIINDVRKDPKIDGRTLKLTIDRTIQFSVDQKLRDGVEKYGADSGSVIVMDTKTGAILADASEPTFDPKTYYDFDTSTYTNPILSSLYEPGSTFKVLVMAAGIDLGLVTPDTRCNICSHAIQMGEYKIKTWDDNYFPNTTMNDVIVHSDNTGMVFVGQKIGVNNLVKYLKKFGFGEPTGIDLQGETTGIIRSQDQWIPIDLATTSFGQGISLTPIQLITAVNSIANNGVRMKPHVVSQIITPDGQTIDVKPVATNRTVSAVTAKTVTSMMVNAVENGEAKFAKIKDYKIAGKTGTAQIPVAGHYDPSQTVASFVGFFPPSDPKVTMLVLFNRPKSSIYGAETAAPLFFSIARDLIKYYNLPPE
ncbi:MAG TPA: penicillin-binding protein 2 [Patescibacteria group bacterium]|nr:penicillin-binding protein 2 [Patescibacteria group bacterium]